MMVATATLATAENLSPEARPRRPNSLAITTPVSRVKSASSSIKQTNGENRPQKLSMSKGDSHQHQVPNRNKTENGIIMSSSKNTNSKKPAVNSSGVQLCFTSSAANLSTTSTTRDESLEYASVTYRYLKQMDSNKQKSNNKIPSYARSLTCLTDHKVILLLDFFFFRVFYLNFVSICCIKIGNVWSKWSR